MTCYPEADWACYPNVGDLDPEVKATAELLGWSAFNSLIGYQVPGNCPVTVRPCSRRFTIGTWYESRAAMGSLTPFLLNGVWMNGAVNNGAWLNSCGCNTDICSCTFVHQIALPGPIGEITEVRVDGVVLDASAYRVDNGIYLVRQDGEPWPTFQNMNADITEVGTFAVTYTRGYPVNPLFALAAGRLAAEFAKACMSQACALPTNVTAVTRQGVTQEFQQNPFDQGTTGMPDVDAIVRIFNPYGLKTPPVVISPDIERGRTRSL